MRFLPSRIETTHDNRQVPAGSSITFGHLPAKLRFPFHGSVEMDLTFRNLSRSHEQAYSHKTVENLSNVHPYSMAPSLPQQEQQRNLASSWYQTNVQWKKTNITSQRSTLSGTQCTERSILFDENETPTILTLVQLILTDESCHCYSGSCLVRCLPLR